MSKRLIRWEMDLGFWSALVLIALVTLLAFWTTRMVAETSHWVEHTHRVIETLGDLRAALAETESGVRGYVLTGDPARLPGPFPDRLRALESSLRTQTADNATEQRRLDQLASLFDHRITHLEAVIARRRVEGFDLSRAAENVPEGDGESGVIRGLITTMVSEERSLLLEREHRTARSLAEQTVVHLGGVLTSGLILFVAFGRLRREVRLRIESEQVARQGEANLATTLRSIGDGVIATDTFGHIVRMNPIAEHLTGWNNAEALGRPFVEVFQIVNEVTRAPAEDPVARVLREGVVVGLANHTLLIARDGTETPIADSAAPIRSEGGEFTGVVMVFRDAAADREAEAKLKEAHLFLDSIVENIPDMVFVKSADDLCFKRINRAGEVLLGTTRDQLLGRSDLDLFPREQADVFRAKDREVLTQGTLMVIAEEPLATPQGIRWLHTKKIPILGEHGAPSYLLGISEDITERKQMADELRMTNVDLERRVEARTAEMVATNAQLQAEIAEHHRTTVALKQSENQFRQAQKMEAVGRLAGGIAHDFNNLLSVILSYSTLLEGDFAVGDSHRTDLQEITRAGERAADLTRQLLAFSRQQVLAPRVLDLNTVVAEMGNMLRRLLGEDVELRLVACAELGKVKVDPGQVEQVIMNLVVNARDAMPSGGILTIETDNVVLDPSYAAEHLGTKAGPHVMLAVTDTGIGMDLAIQAKIFEPFFTTKEQGKGTGLGLSTVFGIVQQSGGTVWVYSEPGKGTTFKIYFPRTDSAGESSHAPPPIAAPSRGSETILLVEDDTQVRVLARNILKRAGYQVLDAESAEAAIHLCERFSGHIHLVLTDVVMPKLSGRHLVEQLSTLRPTTRVLFMSGYTDDTVVHHGVLDAGVAFLQKPITPAALTNKVREVLDAPAPDPTYRTGRV